MIRLPDSPFKIGAKALITTDNWFITPSGEQYRAAFGTIRAVRSSEDALGVRTNAKSTNWYIELGHLLIAGCQIHYAIQTDHANLKPFQSWKDTPEGVAQFEKPSSIYDADEEYQP